jgi:hypothetical protein
VKIRFLNQILIILFYIIIYREMKLSTAIIALVGSTSAVKIREQRSAEDTIGETDVEPNVYKFVDAAISAV